MKSENPPMSARRRGRKQRRSFEPLQLLYALFLLAWVQITLTSCGWRTRLNAVELPAGMPENLSCVVETEDVSGATRTDDGEMLAAYNYQIPVMKIYRRNGSPLSEETATGRELDALRLADTFNKAFERWQTEADFPALETLAKQDYAAMGQDKTKWGEHYAQGLESSVYQTSHLVSVSGRFYYYAGGAHPNTVLLGWNYDLEQGEFVSAGQLFRDTEPVTEELIRQANAQAAEWNAKPEVFFWKDYADILSEWSESAAVITFDENRMTIAYSPYDLACYAAGEQVFTLSRAWIDPCLNQYGKRLLS